MEIKFFVRCITYYEVKRALLVINATRQLANFQQFYNDYEVLFVDDTDLPQR